MAKPTDTQQRWDKPNNREKNPLELKLSHDVRTEPTLIDFLGIFKGIG